MKYKIDLEGRFEEKKSKVKNCSYVNINSWNEDIANSFYSKDEELFILNAKESKMSTKEIAEILNRPYWGIVDKLRRMKDNQTIK